MRRFFLSFGLLCFATQVLSASAIAQGTDDKGKSDRTSKKLGSTSSISITADVESKVDGQKQGEGSAASKGQVTIPLDIRNKFGFLPGMEVDIIAEGNKALIVKSRRENKFIKWVGRGKRRSKKDVDQIFDKVRGRSDE